MIDKENALVFNTTAAKHATLAIEIDIAQRIGFDGIETTASKIRSYLDADHSVSDLMTTLDGFPIYGIGTILNIERHGNDKQSLTSDTQAILELAHRVGAKGVQVITGPIDHREVVRFHEGQPRSGYRGVLEYNLEDRIAISVSALQMVARMAEQIGIVIYLEALAWTPLNTIAHQLALLRRVNQDNLKMVIDYWHCYASGDHPEDVGKIDREWIYGVHVCDSLLSSSEVPNEVVMRDVPTGQGVLERSEI